MLATVKRLLAWYGHVFHVLCDRVCTKQACAGIGAQEHAVALLALHGVEAFQIGAESWVECRFPADGKL